jgi:hypothetical protein
MLTSCVCIDSVWKKNPVLLCQGACAVRSCYSGGVHMSNTRVLRHLRMPNWLLFCLMMHIFCIRSSLRYKSSVVFGLQRYRRVSLHSTCNWLHWAVFLLLQIGQRIYCVLCNLQVGLFTTAHHSPLSWSNVFTYCPSYSFTIHFNIIPPYTPRSSKRYHSNK